MKKWIAILLALTMLAGLLAACGQEETPAPQNNATEGNHAAEAPQVNGETFDVGNYTVLVPEGWKAFPVQDFWSDDANAVDADQINIVKGGETDLDVLTKPLVQIAHYAPDFTLLSAKDYYENAEDVAPITAGGITWEGFSAEDLMGSPVVILTATAPDGHQYQASVFYQTDAGAFQLTDNDFLAILSSVTAK